MLDHDLPFVTDVESRKSRVSVDRKVEKSLFFFNLTDNKNFKN